MLSADPNARYRYAQAPLRVYWEITRACDLTCLHCRAEAQPLADPDELTTAEGLALIDQVARFASPPPRLVLTGGDPLKRDDLFTLIAHAAARGIGVSVAPSATPLLTAEALRRLKDAGVEAISLSLDAADASVHDALRGVPGTFARTCDAAQVAATLRLPFQVNTLVCQRTVDQLPALFDLVQALGAPRWSLFFLVSVGRGELLESISPERAEAVLGWLADRRGQAMARGLVITTTEAPQLRRVIEQRAGARAAAGGPARDGAGRLSSGLPSGPGHPPAEGPAGHARHPAVAHGAGIRDGNGVLFINHRGDICPSGFLELAAGSLRHDDLADTYRQAPLFQALRDPDSFGGRCGTCPYRWPCGGSRARAYAASGNILAEDPLCTYRPI